MDSSKKNILLLGGFGFIGSNILTYIDENLVNKYNVIVFDKSYQHQLGIKFKCVKKTYYGNFSDEQLIEKVFAENKIDVVLHSISTTVPAISTNICFDIESNVLPTISLLNIMVKYSVKRIVYLSSGGAIYGSTNSEKKHKETDLAWPLSSYGVVKLTIEKYLHLFYLNEGINYLSLRLSNPYGRFHFNPYQGVINVALRAAITKSPFNVWGDGHSMKDYIFIDDFCDILLNTLIEQDFHNHILNIGSGEILTVNNILHEIKSAIPSFEWQYINKLKMDIQHCELDLTELNDIVQFNFTKFSEGLVETIKWIKETQK